MENLRRLATNINRYEAGHSGVPRKGAALLQGIAVCGRCARRMSLRYSGPAGDYPVYTCPRRPRSGRRAAMPGSAGIARRCACRKHPARGLEAGQDRDRHRRPWPDRRGDGSGHCGANGRAMRRKEHGANMMLWSRRTVWWHGRWSAAGKRSCALPRRSNRITNDGDPTSPWS